jgi:hypothetical protein
MSPELQSLLALLAVGIAAVWLVRRAFRKNAHGCSGEGCGAISPEVKELQQRLKRG